MSRIPIITKSIYGHVYLVTNTVNGRKYIGQHKYDCVGVDPMYRGSGELLLKAIKKHGKDKFLYEVIDYAESKGELDKLEELYIEQSDAVHSNDFYNLTSGGTGGNTTEGGSNLGGVITNRPEVRDKISQTMINNGTTKGSNNPFSGKKHSPEAKAKMSAAKRGKKLSEEHKKNLEDHLKSLPRGKDGRIMKRAR